MITRSLRHEPSVVVGAVVAVALLSVGAAAPSAGAADGQCVVVNASAGTSPRSDLQAALDEASAGDALKVSGVCIGSFVVVRDVALVGVATSGTPKATLDAAGDGRVLDVVGKPEARPHVVLTDVTLTGGSVIRGGGGIRVIRGSLDMDGTTLVVGNAARGGAGVLVRRGDVTMSQASSVKSNTATNKGGGIRVLRSDFQMLDGTVVSGNSAVSGAGIHSRGRVVMDDNATVAKNGVDAGATAIWNEQPGALVVRGDARVVDNHGRGIANNGGSVVLQGRALVAGNINWHSGAGVLNQGGTLLIQGHAKVRANEAKRVGSGGGVLVYAGTLTLLDHARVSHNTSVHGGGGITVYGDTSVAVFNDSTVVQKNTTEGYGGGVEVLRGVLHMQGKASITENTALNAGGAIWVDPRDDATALFDPAWTGTVCGNTPDDWPSCA